MNVGANNFAHCAVQLERDGGGTAVFSNSYNFNAKEKKSNKMPAHHIARKQVNPPKSQASLPANITKSTFYWRDHI